MPSSKLRAAAVFITAALLLAAADKPPQTRRDNVREVIHGITITDPYRWLEDQESPETRAWIDAQNAYSRAMFDAMPGREQLKRRIAELRRVDIIGMPVVRNGLYFFSRRRPDQDLSVLYFRRSLKGKDEVLLDPHPLSADHSVSAFLASVSEDASIAAYVLRRGGQDEVTVAFRSTSTLRDLPDRMPAARYHSVSITPDNRAVYYTRVEKTGPRIYRHRIGQDIATDQLVFGQGLGPEMLARGSLSEDGRYLLIQVSHGVGGATRDEVYYQDLVAGGPTRTVVNDLEAKFNPYIGGNSLYLWTNWKARNWRILSIDLNEPPHRIADHDNWREVVPEAKSVIDSFSLAGRRLFVGYLENVVSRVRLFSPEGKHLRDISFPTLGTVTTAFGRWTSDEAFYLFTSYQVPFTIYRYQVSSGNQEVWSRQQVPVDSNRFEVKQVWYLSKDGAKIPMFLVYKTGLKADRYRPVLLTGYGGFSASSTPFFNAQAVVWAERGGIFAEANLRGGGEFGEAWHEAGMLARKQNVFDDFIGAAEWLIKNGYTQPSKISIEGTSNGGLLVGAALTQRPDLFQAVVCRYPLLDMIRYHRFLVARWWVPEYGSSADPEQFKYLFAYSPYHHVKTGMKYPAVLMVSGDADTRVAPLHARKMTALLQASTASNRPIALKYEIKSGHAGGRPLGLMIEDEADELGFLLWQLGELK